MKKILLFILSFISVTIIFNQGKSVSHEEPNTFFAYAMYSNSVYEINYEWKGKIIETTSLDIHNDSVIPLTFFHVEVLEDYSDQLDDNVIVAYYGGYVDDKLYLMEGMEYPQENKTYDFYNSTFFTHNNYQVLLVEAPHHMIEEGLYQPLTWGPPEDSDNPGGGGGAPYSNISFQTATVVSSSTHVLNNVVLHHNYPRYYKFTTNHKFIVSIATFGTVDTTVTLYKSNYSTLAYNDDVVPTEINAGLFVEDVNSGTYYVKVTKKNPGASGTITLHMERTNPDIVVPQEGVQESVNVNNQVVYKDSTNMYGVEINYAANIWNKLISNKVVPASPSLPKTVEILLVQDIGVAGGRYIYMPNGNAIIELNQLIFSQEFSGPEKINSRIHIIAHELGHALGIDHTINNRNIMHTHFQERLAFGTYDIIYFNHKWR